MKNNKGFLLIELLAATVVISVLFVTIYASFIPSEAEYERRLIYNDISSNYATYYIRKLYNNYIDLYNEEQTDENLIFNEIKSGITFENDKILLYDAPVNPETEGICYGLGNQNENLTTISQGFLGVCSNNKNLIQDLNIDKIYLTKYNTENVITGNEGTDNYIKSIDYAASTLDSEAFRLVIKFNNNNKITYATSQLLVNFSDSNKPIITSNMIPVYYDETSHVWRKADSRNRNRNYKWYDYNESMWANAVTLDHKTAYDLSNNGYNASSGNNTYSTSEGFSFNGSSTAGLIATDTKSTNFSNSEISVATKIKLASLPTGTNKYMIVSKSNSKEEFSIYVNSAGKVVFEIRDTASSTYKTLESISVCEINTEYTILATYDNNEMRLYINSSDEDSSSIVGQITWKYNSNIPILIGAAPNSSGTIKNSNFNGIISYIAVTKSILQYSDIIEGNDTWKYTADINTVLYYDLVNNGNTEMFSEGDAIDMNYINTMWVWIPRYKYTIFNYNNDGSAVTTSLNPDPTEKAINIEFERGTASTGEITCIDNIQGSTGSTGYSQTCYLNYGLVNQTICTDITCNGKTYTHPAFTFGEQELPGIWVGKFETASSNPDATYGGSTSTTLNVIIKPNITSWRGNSVSGYFQVSRKMELYENIYGFEQDINATSLNTTTNDGTIINDSNNIDTHMMKNMEWGAVAYLSQSIYGRCTEDNLDANGTCPEVFKNNSSSYYTGRSGGNAVASGVTGGSYTYEDYNVATNGTMLTDITAGAGTGASTTANIYGIYDMSGGAWDRTMGNMVNSDGNLYVANAGLWTTSTPPLSKYYDKYSYGTTINDATAFKRGKLGEGTKEIIKSISVDGGWYEDSTSIVNNASSHAWILRGEDYAESATGIFSSGKVPGSGGIPQSYSTRTTLAIW